MQVAWPLARGAERGPEALPLQAGSSWFLEAQASVASVSFEPLHPGRGGTPREQLLHGG